MSDFEQWYESEFDSGLHYDATDKAWQAAIASMQGEAVGIVEVGYSMKHECYLDDGDDNFFSPLVDANKIPAGTKLFTYQPSAASKLAEQHARIKELEAENANLKMAIEYDNADDDADWEPPHPIFQLAQERDNFMLRIKQLEQQLEEARKYADRWQSATFIYADNPHTSNYHKATLSIPWLRVEDYTRESYNKAFDAAIRQIGGAE